MITPLQNLDKLTDAIAYRVIKYTPQIYRVMNTSKKSNAPYEAIGSSVLLNIQDRKFLITAGHIVNNQIGQIGFIEDGFFHILDGRWIYINPDLDKSSKYKDLAICELDIESREFLSKYFDFVDGSKINFDYYPADSKNYLLVGFPWRKTHYNYIKQKMHVIPFKFLTDIYKNDHLGELKTFQHQNLILDYTQRRIINLKTGFLKKAVNPEGLSGCGVWHIPKVYVEDETKAIANLAGIIIRQDEHTHRYIIATRIHIVSEMLRVYFNLNLKPSMISRLNKHES